MYKKNQLHQPGGLSYLQAIMLCCIMLSFFLEISYSQDTVQIPATKKYLGIYINAGLASFREDLLVPLGFHGPAFALGGVYTHQSQNYHFQIQLQIGLGHLKNRYSHEAWVLKPDIRLSWVKKLSDYGRYGTLWGGVCLPHQMVNLFIESWDDAHLYWLNAYGVGPALRWEKQVSQKNNIIFRMEFPLISLVSRPATYRYKKQEPLNHWTYHFTEPNRSLQLKTITEYRTLFIQLLFRKELDNAVLHAGFEFLYNYCRTPEEIRGYNTSLIISYQWRI